MLVAVDKFTKWIEYKPIVKISSDRAVDSFRTSSTGLFVRLRIYSWTMKYCHPNLASAGVIAR